MNQQIGQKAPSFSLSDTERKRVSLEDLKGKNVVLLFFPLAFTGVCTAELCSVRDNISMYNGLDAEVFGISVDAGPSLKKFKEEQKLNFTLLSDFNKEMSRAYGVLYEDWFGMKGVSKRSAFVIDREGTIRYAEVLESADEQPDFQAIRQALESLN
jgi:glutaredoxin-dependent peroxiredoxin